MSDLSDDYDSDYDSMEAEPTSDEARDALFEQALRRQRAPTPYEAARRFVDINLVDGYCSEEDEDYVPGDSSEDEDVSELEDD